MQKKFAFVAEGEVFMVWTFDPTDHEEPTDRIEMIIAGMSSDPRVIEAAPGVDVAAGWTHNGVEFLPPQ